MCALARVLFASMRLLKNLKRLSEKLPSPVSKLIVSLSQCLRLAVCRWSSLLTGEEDI
jgi:hypothetical protein